MTPTALFMRMSFRGALGSLLILLCVTGCGDVVASRYSTRANAEASRLFQRGWLPAIIPESSFNIVTRNNLDINTSRGEFYFDRKHLPTFLSHLTKKTPSASEGRYQDYLYSEGKTHWLFSLDAKRCHCTYSLTPER